MKRYYFMAVKSTSEDGASIITSSAIADITTASESPYKAQEILLKSLKEELRNEGYKGSVVITSFNRI